MNKYRAKGQYFDGKWFSSQKELRRYRELELLQRAGKIKDLVCQPVFKFPIKYDSGRVMSYKADFQYTENPGRPNAYRVVEDVKGFKTQVYKIKKALVKHFHGVEIKEV